MASCLVTRLFWITCFAIASYAFPSTDENDAEMYLTKFLHLQKPADKETLTIRDDEAVSTAIKDFPELNNLSETGESDNETMAVINLLRCGAKNKTGHCVRNKRSVEEDICKGAKLDTVTRIANGRIYAFKGSRYWEVRDHSIPATYPKAIFDDWDGLPENLDASFTSNDKTYFFKGSQYWRFVNKRMDDDYPKLISEDFPGIPDNVNAALTWRGGDKVYFFKGPNYWLYKFNSGLAGDYPQAITEKWGSLLANGIDAAFHFHQRQIYFFKDDVYYLYNGETYAVVEARPPYPRSTATEWLGCQ